MIYKETFKETLQCLLTELCVNLMHFVWFEEYLCHNETFGQGSSYF